MSVPLDGSDEPTFWKSRALMVRLAPGVPREIALADLNVAFQQYVADSRLSERARAQAFKRLDLAPAASGLPEFRDRYGKPVQAMLAIVAVLLVIACANLASLFLARATARQRDLSVCLALGASRARVWHANCSRRHSSSRSRVERSACSSPRGASNALVAFLPGRSARQPTCRSVRTGTSCCLRLAASTMTGLVIGLAPAWFAGKVDLRDMLATGGRTVAGRRLGLPSAHRRFRSRCRRCSSWRPLLFAVSLNNLKTQSTGFAADGVLMVTADADGTGLEGDRLGEVHRQILERLRGLPGVQHATLATIPPLSSNEDGKGISIPGVHVRVSRRWRAAGEHRGTGLLRYLRRAHPERPRHHRARTAARRRRSPSSAKAWRDTIFQVSIRWDGAWTWAGVAAGGQIEIVGVASDVRYRDLRRPAARMAYLPAFQREAEESTVFAIRTAGDPVHLTQPAEREIHAVAPTILTTEIKTLLGRRDETLVNERLLALLSACFGGLGLLLAGIGVYGVVNYSVTQRTAELGLRIALGASRAGLLWLVVRRTLALVILAVVLGVIAAFLTSSFLSSFLFGIQPAEPWVYSATMALLIAIALVAAVGPTLRATRIDPIDTLRWQ